MSTTLSLCSQDSSAARSQYWLRIQTEIFFIYKKLPQPVPFFYSSQSALVRRPDWWDKLSPACYGLPSPCVFQMAPGTWCNQALRGECECVWSCKPTICSAADDQVGGEDDLWAVRKGHHSTSKKAPLLGFKKDPDRDLTDWVVCTFTCTVALLHFNQILWYKEYYRDVKHFIINTIPLWITPNSRWDHLLQHYLSKICPLGGN